MIFNSLYVAQLAEKVIGCTGACGKHLYTFDGFPFLYLHRTAGRPDGFEPPTTWFEVRYCSRRAFVINKLRQVSVAHLHTNAQRSRTESGKTPAVSLAHFCC